MVGRGVEEPPVPTLSPPLPSPPIPSPSYPSLPYPTLLCLNPNPNPNSPLLSPTFPSLTLLPSPNLTLPSFTRSVESWQATDTTLAPQLPNWLSSPYSAAIRRGDPSPDMRVRDQGCQEMSGPSCGVLKLGREGAGGF